MAKSNIIYEFSFNEQLPRVYEVVYSIISVSPGAAYFRTNQKESANVTDAIHGCSIKLKELWEKAFGTGAIKSLTAIKYQIRKELKNYSTFMVKKKDTRTVKKAWRVSNSILFECLAPKVNVNDFDEIERNFYLDQKYLRNMFLSEEIDLEYERDGERKMNQFTEAIKSVEAELEYIFAEDEENDSEISNKSSIHGIQLDPKTNLSLSVSRSGVYRVTCPTHTIGIQTDLYNVSQPPVRKVRDCTEEIKSALANVSVAAEVSPEKARLAAQAFSKYFYGHSYYLNPSEKDPIYEIKKPRKADEYAFYNDVFPGNKTIVNFKHSQSLHHEVEAAKALINKNKSSKAILHFDTTKRSRVEGDWASLILDIQSPPNCSQPFVLRPLYFALETKENIAKLIVETLYRLSITISSTPAVLWEMLDGFMTDSVSKNLDVEKIVAGKLGSNYIPEHFLCVSHTIEKFDIMCISVLVDIEKKISLRGKIESSHPELKSFFRGKQCIVQCAIVALCKLICPDTSGKSSSLSDEFDLLIEKQKRVKTVYMYQERRFTKLGTTAASIVDSLDLYQLLLDQTTRNNLLVKASKLYVNCEYIICALTCLAYFTYKIEMPFLNMVEKSSQKDLKKKSAELYNDLKQHNLDCLSDWHVEWKRVKISSPESDLGKLIIGRMCDAVAEGLRLQRGREYGFYNEDFTPRAAIISEIQDMDLELIPSNNLICERNLSKFSNLAERSAKCSNRHFKAKCIRDDITLYKVEQMKKVSNSLKTILDQCEYEWYKEQKKVHTSHLEKLLEEGRKRNDYADRVLVKCKSWTGPFSSVKELEASLVGSNEKKTRDILRHEITFQRITHPNDAIVRKELYLINKQDISTLKYNLVILLSNTAILETNDGEIFLPTESEVMDALNSYGLEENVSVITEDLDIMKINEPKAIVWEENNELKWYIGFILSIDSPNSSKVEHLTRVLPGTDKLWQYPQIPDVQDTDIIQILPIEVIGEWDYSNPKKSVFEVKNCKEINAVFKIHIDM